MKEIIQQAVHLYCRALTVVLAVLLTTLVAVVLYQLLSRNTGALPVVIWSEEVSRFLFVWMLFCGAAIAVREGVHFKVDILPDAISARFQRGFGILVVVVIAVIGLVMMLGGGYLASIGQARLAPQTGVSMAWVYSAIPFSGVSILIFLAERVARGDVTEFARNPTGNLDERGGETS